MLRRPLFVGVGFDVGTGLVLEQVGRVLSMRGREGWADSWDAWPRCVEFLKKVIIVNNDIHKSTRGYARNRLGRLERRVQSVQ